MKTATEIRDYLDSLTPEELRLEEGLHEEVICRQLAEGSDENEAKFWACVYHPHTQEHASVKHFYHEMLDAGVSINQIMFDLCADVE